MSIPGELMTNITWQAEDGAAYAYIRGELVGKVERDADLLWLAYDLRPEATDDAFVVCKTEAAAIWRVEERLQPKTPLVNRRRAA